MMNKLEKEVYELTKRVMALENGKSSSGLEKRVKVLENARQRQIKLNMKLLDDEDKVEPLPAKESWLDRLWNRS